MPRVSDDDERPDPEETAVMDRRRLGAAAAVPADTDTAADPDTGPGPAGDAGATAAGARRRDLAGPDTAEESFPDEPTVVQPAVRLATAPATAPETPARRVPARPVEPAVVPPRAWAEPVPAPVQAPVAAARPPAPDGDVVRFPYRLPWTAGTAGVLAILFGLEAAFELAFNWSRYRGNPRGRFGGAVLTLDHTSSALADALATAVASPHFVATHAFDHRIALGAFAALWLIVGLLLLLARGSGIVLGLLWCGIVALPAFTRTRVRIARFGWGLHHLDSAALTAAAVAPLVLIALVAGLGASRRARLHSARPSDPEFVEVNEPGAVWRDR